MLKNKRTIIIFVIQLVLVILILWSVKADAFNSVKVWSADASDWNSSWTEYNGCWSVVDGEKGQYKLLFQGDRILERGYYTIAFNYETEKSQKIQLHAFNSQEVYVEANPVLLKYQDHEAHYDFRVTEDVDSLELLLDYGGEGITRLNNIVINSNKNGYKKLCLLIVFILVLGDGVYFKREYIKSRQNTVVGLLGIAFLASVPVFAYGINWGHDLVFHLMRIEGIAEELKHFVFPVRMSSAWINGYGYPVSVYYGDILLYFPACLRLCGFSIIEAYKIFIFSINLVNTVISYLCFKAIFGKKNISVVATMGYTLATYRLVNLYIRAAVGEYCAMIFLPMIAMAIYRAYSDEDSKYMKYYSLILALGMTGLFHTHIISVEMTAIVIAIVSIVMIKKTFSVNIVKFFACAILETIAFSLSFLIPFLDYYINIPIHAKELAKKYPLYRIQSVGVYISQLFSFSQTPFGGNNLAVSERMSITPGIVLMGSLIIAVLIWINGKADLKLKYLVSFSCITLLMSTNCFPWDRIEKLFSGANILVQIQFPWRYLSVSTVVLSLVLGVIISIAENNHRVISYAVMCGIVVCTFSFAGQYANNCKTVTYYDLAEIDSAKAVMGGEYVLVEADEDNLDLLPKKIECNQVEIGSANKNKNVWVFECKSEQGGTFDVPIFNYKGYRAVDDNGVILPIISGTNGEITVCVPDNFDGIIRLRYVSPWYWRVGEIVTLLSFVVFSGWVFMKRHELKGVMH